METIETQFRMPGKRAHEVITHQTQCRTLTQLRIQGALDETRSQLMMY